MLLTVQLITKSSRKKNMYLYCTTNFLSAIISGLSFEHIVAHFYFSYILNIDFRWEGEHLLFLENPRPLPVEYKTKYN